LKVIYILIPKIIGDYIKRDCGIKDGDKSLLVLRNQKTKEIFSYYKSQGIEGYLNDSSKKYLNQKELIKKVLNVISDCT